ncbi:uncharacterized protein LOC110672679 isoform X2 [Hevea brasiliensis]|uniref:uncharacterized protein LOC110672679 isoform X2 n=1 Tax=Hevea brasiliensis TaxID=3981 RepID=UPI0025DCB40D|nr:uncharacterized protein LOC110672679 isoform X2 [Hevea brasiliensis]
MEIQRIVVCLESQHTPNPQEQEQVEVGSRRKPKVEKPEMIEIVNLDDGDDDVFFYSPISNKGNTRRTAIAVEQYSEERDLNLAIIASLKSTNKTNKQENFVHLSHDNHDYYYVDDVGGGVDDDDDDVRVLNFKPQSNISKVGRNSFKDSVTECGQSSKAKSDPEFVCEICVEPKTGDESFDIKGCTHAYCRDCMAKYLDSKLQDNIAKISCPVSGCAGSLEPEYCRSILPQEVFDRWGNALCEALIMGCQKFYCPFKDCSAMLIDDGGEVIRESECPNCRRMFCAQCKVPWHSGIQCQEFQKLHEDEREKEDIMLMKLAENKHWRRCPNCRIYVERTQGCRCGAAFCYSCGTAKTNTSSHYCNYCKG